MISHSDEQRGLSPFMKQWLDGPMRRVDFSGWEDKDLVVLWWDIAVFLHRKYGPKLGYLEGIMKDRGMDIPRNLDKLMGIVRNFL